MENIDFSNSNNIEDVMQQAKDKGLYCVNQNDTSGVYQDYLDVLVKSEELLSIDDPVETPYLSKYEARKQIDEVINKLEATKTIASLEKNKSLMNAMNWRVASLRVKLGGISWDVEEPHNAQIELEQALDYYFPTLATVVNACLNDESDSSESGADTNANPEAVGKSLEYNMDEYLGLVEQGLIEQNEKNKLDDLLPSITNINYNTVCSTLSSGAVDAMKCLNLLGILWAGRVQLKKSFYYMLCVKSIYLKLKSTIQLETGTSHASFGPTPPPVPVYEKVSKEEQIAEIESLYTHNLFYLAQAYGHVGNTKQSSLYCYNTLYRQLKAGLSTNKAILEWCTNCQGLCDFFCAIENFEKAGYILNVCDKLLKTAYNPNTDGNASPIDMSEHNSYLECLANVNRRYVKLDLLCIRNAIDYYEKWTHVDSTFVIDNRIPSNVDMSTSAGLIEKLKLTVEANDILDEKGASVDALPPPPPASDSAVPPVTNDPQLDTHGDMDAELSFQPFPNLDIDPIPFITSDIFNYKEPSNSKDADVDSQNTNINSYGDVKKVFVRAQSRLEAAKKYYVMDGFVTDHVHLLLDHSHLYQSLSNVEPDNTRKLAMALKRAELLQPVLLTVNRTVYEDIHKQLSYELGEIFMMCVELKIEKLLIKQITTQHGLNEKNLNPIQIQYLLQTYLKNQQLNTQELDIKYLKMNDITTVNSYIMKALSCFVYYSNFYCKKPKKANEQSGNGDPDVPKVEEINEELEKQEQAANMISALAGVNVNMNKSNQTLDYNGLYVQCFKKELISKTNKDGVDIQQLDMLIGSYCTDPDIRMLTEGELRPYLNCHFLSCRLFTKILPSDSTQDAKKCQINNIICSLKRYEWLKKFVDILTSTSKTLTIDHIPFSDEYTIICDMCTLLPKKIDSLNRM